MQIDNQKIKILIDSIIGDFLPPGAGASLGIVYDGKILNTINYGFSDIGNSILCNSKTNYRLASVTKQFTAVCILQLIEKGELSLGDKVSDYFLNFSHGTDISIYNLLTHTSGLYDFEELLNTEGIDAIHDHNVLSILSCSEKLKFTPGTSWDYNNGNYCILKELIEKVSEKSFDEYVEKNIFSILGMNNSFFMSTRKNGKNRAYGYELRDDKLVKNDYNAGSFTLGDGGIYSSIEDLSKWIIHKEKILSSEMYKFSNEGLIKKIGEKGYYGCGQNMIESGKNQFLIHAGYTQGFRSSIGVCLGEGLGVIFLSNYHVAIPDEDFGSSITRKILEFILKM